MAKEKKVDAAAEGLGRELAKAQAGDKARSEGPYEYGSVIYRPRGGQITASKLETSKQSGRARFRAPAAAEAKNGGEILGFFHNHPYEYAHTRNHNENNNNPSQSDWNQFDRFVTQEKADRKTLAMYLVGTDGILREFHDEDRGDHNADKTFPKKPDSDNNVRNGQCKRGAKK